MNGNLVCLQVLTKQIDDGLVIYSSKKIYFSEFSGFSHSLCMSYYIGVFFHPEKDLKIMKPKN